jgi:hypothetical protein
MDQRSSHPPLVNADRLFDGGGETGALLRAIDWAQTPLGPVERWPQSLKTIVRIMLTSRQPIWIGWGPDLIKMYNDPYKAIVGGKHPQALGQPASLVWQEIWDDIGPRLQQAMQTNEGTYDESLLLIMERYGYAEETHYSFQTIVTYCLVDTIAGSASARDWTHHEPSNHTGRTAHGLYLLPTLSAGVRDYLSFLSPQAMCLSMTDACRTVGQRTLVFYPLSSFRAEPLLPKKQSTTSTGKKQGEEMATNQEIDSNTRLFQTKAHL